MRVCVKVGGGLIEDAAARARLARTLAGARAQGHELLVVHGGGRQIRAAATRLGLAQRRHEGLRVTDARTAQVVTWVLAGEVNKTLVHALEDAGLAAVGLTGADLGLFAPRRKKAAVDLGFVGELGPDDVHADRLRPLLDQGICPVLATLGPEAGAAPGTPFLNVNADEAAAPIAAAAGAAALVVLSDVAGVLDAAGTLLPRLGAARAASLIEEAVIRGGMVPKVRAALGAVRAGVATVRIVSGEEADPIAAALAGGGTRIEP